MITFTAMTTSTTIPTTIVTGHWSKAWISERPYCM